MLVIGKNILVDGALSRPDMVCHVVLSYVLGPTLWLSAMKNDVNLWGDSFLFADNTALYSGVGNPIETGLKSEELFNKIWFQANRINLNENKTQRIMCTLSRTFPLDMGVFVSMKNRFKM